MKWHDISLLVHENMPMFPGDPQPRFQPYPQPSQQTTTEPPDEDKASESSASDNPETQLRMTQVQLLTHTGTHVDAPAHILPRHSSIDQVTVDQLIGHAVVISVTPENFNVGVFEKLPVNWENKIVLFKTGESRYLKKGIIRSTTLGAPPNVLKYLIQAGIKAVGIDSLSIDPLQSEELTAHKILLEEGIPIIEGLDLEEINDGEYYLICLPLKLKGLDGAPARAVLGKPFF